ncbi:glycosyltransferase [Serpentinimonas raichei]|uniref:Glycosyltransferase n=2 Tax=Serpentinimonas raichei TaxID=1458425 RepID=A0A060NH40_9BURK|nr:glycosyltransferase [Serpentinimonas raichei]
MQLFHGKVNKKLLSRLINNKNQTNMIFIANVLEMNGGSTFLLRVCEEYKKQNKPVAVLVLRNKFDVDILQKLKKLANVYFLHEFLIENAVFFRAHLTIWGLIHWAKLFKTFSPFGYSLHVMGMFGLIFACRMLNKNEKIKISVGIYHQNEFLFKKTNHFFLNKALECFAKLDPKQIVFYNEATKINYAHHFSRDYAESKILPIGIQVPAEIFPYKSNSMEIVSLGNLVNFKTYNEHTIKTLPHLLKKFPLIKYKIYGTGEMKHYLVNLVRKLNLDNSVEFCGAVEYSRFQETLKNSALFVGSGTSLIEAASFGIPAVVGIESIDEPLTYGFISDIEGLSYNENVDYLKKVSYISLFEKFFGDKKIREELSARCKKKSEEFCICKTIAGFDELNLQLNKLNLASKLSRYDLTKMLISFIVVAFNHLFFKEKSFASRRNQSF